MSKRLPMAATIHYMKTREKDDSVAPSTYIDKVNFSEHADVIMTDRIKRRDMIPKHQEQQEKLRLCKPAEKYKSDGKEIFIADTMNLNSIIPLEVHQALSVEVPQGVKRPCPFESEPSPSIMKLVRSLSTLCIRSECKDPI